MASTAGISSTGSTNKLILTQRLKSRRLIYGQTDSRQPLVPAFHHALDEPDRLPRKLRVHFYSIVFAVVSALSYVIDFGADLFVGFTQFAHCRYFEGVLILAFAYVPSIFVNILGYLWAVDDLKRRPQSRVTNRLKKPVWIVGLLTQTVPALYSFEAAYYCSTFRRLLAANNAVIDARILELYYWILESDRDSTLLRVFLGFMESAPQLFIQTYVLCTNINTKNYYESDSVFAWIHYISMAFSLFGLSWSMMSQHRCLRYVRQDKENLGILQCLLMLIWRTLTLVGRFLALLLFALFFQYWLALFLAAHYLLTIFIISCIEHPKLADTSTQENLLTFGIGWVHLFCPWNVDEGRTRYRYIWRYGLEWLEFGAILACLHLATPVNTDFKYKYEFIITSACAYAVGLIFMFIYYGCCHPNLELGRGRYPPLVVVYTPPEKIATGGPPIGDAVLVPVIVPMDMPIPEEEAEVCVGCCGSGGGVEGGNGVDKVSSSERVQPVAVNDDADCWSGAPSGQQRAVMVSTNDDVDCCGGGSVSGGGRRHYTRSTGGGGSSYRHDDGGGGGGGGYDGGGGGGGGDFGGGDCGGGGGGTD